MATGQGLTGDQRTVAIRLCDAARFGQVETVRDLLRKHPNEVDSVGDYDSTALMRASVWGHTNVVQLLLEAGASIDKKNDGGQSALHYAVDNGNADVVKTLLQRGAQINSVDENGNTPLFYAIMDGNRNAIELLINNPEIDLSIKNKKGRNLLHLAIGCLGWEDEEKPKLKRIVEKLLQAGLDINSVDENGNTPLFCAIRSWKTEVIELLINHPEIDFGIKNKQGQNLLHCASQCFPWEDEEKPTFKRIVEKLLQAGLDINSVDEDGNTPLCYAIRGRKTEVIELLINHPEIDLSIKNKKGHNLLHYACKWPWLDDEEKPKLKQIVEKLLQAGLDINSVDEDGKTPLFDAIRNWNTEVIELLINHPEIDLSIKNKKGQNFLHCASSSPMFWYNGYDQEDDPENDPEDDLKVIVEKLLQAGVDVNSVDGDGNTPLFDAIMVLNIEVFELLINHPEIDLSIKNKQGQNLLHCATQGSNWVYYRTSNVKQIVEKLLQAGLDINSVDEDGDTPLIYAIKEKNTEVIELLINHPDIDLSIENKKGQNVLHFAIEKSSWRYYDQVDYLIVEKLLQARLDINSVDGDGNTPLFYAITEKYTDGNTRLPYAIWRWNTEIIELLINHPEIDLSFKNKKGQNVLHLAIEKNRTEVVQLMLQNGAAINSVDSDGNTVLHNAIYSGCKEVIEVLINHPNIDFSLKNKYGHNVLHFAVMEEKVVNRSEVIQLLLQQGADCNSVDSDGNTVLHNAIYSGCKEVIEVLINHPKIDFSLKNKYGHNVLHFAIMEEKVVNRAELIKCLLQKGASVNSVDNDGDTPLHNAIYREYIEVIKVLLDHQNIDFSLKNKKGFNALHFALMAEKVVKRPEIVRLLLQKGADVNSMKGADLKLGNDSQQTPLMMAIKACQLSTVKLLVENGADLNVSDEDGDSCLHLAVRKYAASTQTDSDQALTWAGFTIACFLVRNGADVNIRNKEGMTAIDLIQDTEKRKNFEMFV